MEDSRHECEGVYTEEMQMKHHMDERGLSNVYYIFAWLGNCPNPLWRNIQERKTRIAVGLTACGISCAVESSLPTELGKACFHNRIL